MTRSDIVLIVAVLIIALAGSAYLRAPSADQLLATVDIAGEPVLALAIPNEGREEHRITFPRGEAIIEVEDGRVRVLPMPLEVCPLGICSATGWIGRPGQTIVCLPNRILITLRAQDQDVDGVTR